MYVDRMGFGSEFECALAVWGGSGSFARRQLRCPLSVRHSPDATVLCVSVVPVDLATQQRCACTYVRGRSLVRAVFRV